MERGLFHGRNIDLYGRAFVAGGLNGPGYLFVQLEVLVEAREGIK